MLHMMRRFANTWFGKALGAVLLVGLAGFGIQNVLLDLGSNNLARVGSEDISTTQFQRAYRQQLNQVAQQYGQMPTDVQAVQMGIPTAVIQRLASDAAVNQMAVDLGLGVSDAKLGEMVKADPSFADMLGKFDAQSFATVLRQNGYTEAEYFDLQTRAARRQQVALGLFGGTPPSKAASDILNRYRNDQRTVEYFTINSTSIPAIPTPSDDDLKAYLTAHQADYRTKETRTVDIVVFTPEILAQLPDYVPADADVKAEYDRTKDSLIKIEKRHIEQVVLSDPSKEQAFTDAQAKGLNFVDAAQAAGLVPTDLGTLAKSEIQDAALADAAFGLAKTGDFTIIPGIGARRVIGVLEIQAGGQISYDDAKADIAKRLAVTKAKAAYADVQDQIEELRAAFKPLKEIADRFKLPVATSTVTPGGMELVSVAGISGDNLQKVADGIFAAEQGKLAKTVSTGATNNIWFDLTKIDPARDQTFDEVKDKLATDWTAAKTEAALKAEVASITDDLGAGKAFADVASAHGQFPQVSQAFTRDGDKTNVFTQQVAADIFGKGPDGFGSVIDGDGEYLVYHVTSVVAADGDPSKAITDYSAGAVRDSLYAEFIGGLRDAAGIKINQQALSQVLNLGATQ